MKKFLFFNSALQNKFSIWTLGYFLTTIGLFLYSFTQLDLGLTLAKWSLWQVAQKFFQNIGYFQRPFSSFLFTVIIALLFFFYLMILAKVHKNKISTKTIWALIIGITAVLTFSYNAFSYDLFNYIFDAKIITFYQQNPYIHKALDFTNDPMLSFMHWTHRLYPYGPVWLGLTVPLSYLGMQLFLPTFFLFKLFVSSAFLGTVFFISRILKKVLPKDELFGIAFFALNPLVVIESLVSSHNDIVMIFFAMWAIYLLVNYKYVRSIILLFLSIGIKFATLIILPIFLLITWLNNRKTFNWKNIFTGMAVLMIIPIILASYRTNFQPWYLLNILPFAALIGRKYYVFIPCVILSLFAVFEYLPFLYLGNWSNPVPLILFWMTMFSMLLSLAVVMAVYRIRK